MSTRFRTIDRYEIGKHVFKIQEKTGHSIEHYRVHHQYISGNCAVGQLLRDGGGDEFETASGARLAILNYLSKPKKTEGKRKCRSVTTRKIF